MLSLFNKTQKIGATLGRVASVSVHDYKLTPIAYLRCVSCQGSGEWVRWGCQCRTCDGRGYVLQRRP